jgi:penicillin-binding protein 2
MRRLIRRTIPSMFHRRLLLQVAVLAGVLVVLSGRLAMLTIVEGADRLERAEDRLVRQSWTPTTRGRIIDREGRVLAMDRPSYSVAVEYGVLSGEWARVQGRRMAWRVHGERWAEADAGERDALAAPFVERYESHVARMLDRLAEATGTERSQLDTRIAALMARVRGMRDSVAEARLHNLVTSHLAAGRGLTAEDEARLAKAAQTEILEERSTHVLIPDLPDETAFELRRVLSRRVPVFSESEHGSVEDLEVYADLFPGVVIRDSTDRIRPFDRAEVAIDRSTLPGPMKGEGVATVQVAGLGWHTLGTLRGRVYGEDQERRRAAMAESPERRSAWVTSEGVDRGRYMPGDSVGQRGVEASREHDLRGLRGLRTVHLDTGREEEFPPVPGRDVRLTVDAMLEARIRAVLEPGIGLTTVQPWHGESGVAEGETLAGAVVVLDVHTGEVLAMVSTPSPADESRWSEDDEPASYPAFLDPFVNRAIAVPYPPGSIVKPMMLAEAVQRGFHRLGEGVVCTGHLLEDREDVYRCWIYKRYGFTHSPTGEPVGASDSIKYSCNIFYYTLGRRMGPSVVAEVYRELGVGEAFGLGVGAEWAGKVGPNEGPGDGSDLGVSDAILMAMGQGPVTWTPLHAANAYATLARGGAWVRPRLIDDGRPGLAERIMHMDPAAIEAALRGLHDAVNDAGGTGSSIRFGESREAIFNAPGVDLWGKTGTAQAPPLRHDPDGPGPLPERVVREGDHAWFVVLAGPKGGGPRYSIAVLIEYGGGGGRVAGPVANQVVRALVDEGYLPGGPARPSLATGGRP